MARTIYDVAVEKMKIAAKEMAVIIEGFSIPGEDGSSASMYATKRKQLMVMGIWQEKYHFYAQKILSEGIVSKKDKEGLAKLVKGEIE